MGAAAAALTADWNSAVVAADVASTAAARRLRKLQYFSGLLSAAYVEYASFYHWDVQQHSAQMNRARRPLSWSFVLHFGRWRRLEQPDRPRGMRQPKHEPNHCHVREARCFQPICSPNNLDWPAT